MAQISSNWDEHPSETLNISKIYSMKNWNGTGFRVYGVPH